MYRMQKLSDLFREKREKLGIGLDEASSATKIRTSLLSALENSDYEAFTSDTHLKSFIKSYAKYLEINEDKALAMYRRERSYSENDETNVLQKTDKNYSLSFLFGSVFNIKTLTGIVLGLILIGVIYFFYSLWLSANQPPSIVILKPADNEIIEQESFVIEGISNSPLVKIVVDGVDANYVDTQGKFRVNAKFTQPGLKRFTILAVNEFQKRSEYNLDLIYRPKEETVQKRKVKIVNTSNLNQTLSYAKDTKVTFENVNLKAQESFETDFDSKIEFKNFNQQTMDFYIDDDTLPIQSIDSGQFSIIIENTRVIIKN